MNASALVFTERTYELDVVCTKRFDHRRDTAGSLRHLLTLFAIVSSLNCHKFVPTWGDVRAWSCIICILLLQEHRTKNPIASILIADFDDVSYSFKSAGDSMTLFFYMPWVLLIHGKIIESNLSWYWEMKRNAQSWCRAWCQTGHGACNFMRDTFWTGVVCLTIVPVLISRCYFVDARSHRIRFSCILCGFSARHSCISFA